MDRARHLHGPALRYFAAVAEAGSIRAAARDLNVASSAVNRQILWLEDTLGHALFDRQARGVRLTQAGEILRAHALRTLSDFEATAGALDALTGMRRGSVQIASVESVGETLLPGIVAAFRRAYPGLHVSLRLGAADRVAEAVAGGEVDLGFTFEPPDDPRLVPAFQRDLAIGAVMRPDHPLAERHDLCLADCLAYPLCLPAPGLSLRKRLDVVLARHPLRGLAFVETNSLRLMKAIARQDETVAFQTLVGLERDLADGTLVFRPLADPPLHRDRFTVLTSAHRALNQAARAFFDSALTAIEARLSEIDAETAS